VNPGKDRKLARLVDARRTDDVNLEAILAHGRRRVLAESYESSRVA